MTGYKYSYDTRPISWRVNIAVKESGSRIAEILAKKFNQMWDFLTPTQQAEIMRDDYEMQLIMSVLPLEDK